MNPDITPESGPRILSTTEHQAQLLRKQALLEQFLKIQFPSYNTETHLHLGGALSAHSIGTLAVLHGFNVEGRTHDQKMAFLRANRDDIKDLDSYLSTIYPLREAMQSNPELMYQSVMLTAHEALRYWGTIRQGSGLPRVSAYEMQGIELRFNPIKRTTTIRHGGGNGQRGLFDMDRIVLDAIRGADAAEIYFKDTGLKIGFIFCLGRDLSVEDNGKVVRKIKECRERYPGRIIGLDLAGPESENPLSDPKKLAEMAALYDIAAAPGDPAFKRTVHCGETEAIGIETFLATLNALKPNRVGHPIAAYRASLEGDHRGLEFMAKHGITAEFCFESNLMTKRIPDARYFVSMLSRFDEAGVPWSLNTDGCGTHDRNHAEELFELFQYGLTAEQIVAAMHTANQSSFLPRGEAD
ncbi:MAG: hypothetical protein K1X83_00365 [Oligoflexia bacterium]|nr:hypothetical protein [Oligoflexia bacterium]